MTVVSRGEGEGKGEKSNMGHVLEGWLESDLLTFLIEDTVLLHSLSGHPAWGRGSTWTWGQRTFPYLHFTSEDLFGLGQSRHSSEP